jgi:hypothetical protein
MELDPRRRRAIEGDMELLDVGLTALLSNPSVVSFKATGHAGHDVHDALKRRRIDRFKEVSSNAFEMDRPRRPQFRRTPSREFRHIASRINGARLLGHETAQLKAVHQTCHTAGRESGGVGEIRHSQLTIWSLGEMHDGRVLAGREARAFHQIAVQNSRHNFDDPHNRPPEHLFAGRERVDSFHATKANLRGQAKSSAPRKDSVRSGNTVTSEKSGSES